MAGERIKVRILRPKNEKKISGEGAPHPQRGAHTYPIYSRRLQRSGGGAEDKLPPPPKYFLPTPLILIHQRYRQTDGQTDRRHAVAIPRFAL